jgi:hypothetical protein
MAVEHQHIHLVHQVPGRSRFSIPKARRNRKVCDLIQGVGNGVAGVHDIHVNPLTGSAVVHYDRHDPTVRERLAQAVREADSLLSIAVPEIGEWEAAAEVLGAGVEPLFEKFPLTKKIASSIKTADRKLKLSTGGEIDINTLLPLAVAGALLFMDTKSRPVIFSILGLISLHAYITLHASRQR